MIIALAKNTEEKLKLSKNSKIIIKEE